MFRHLINTLLFVLPPSRLFGLRHFLLTLVGVTLGNNVKYCGRAWIYGRGQLIIGDDTWLSPATNIYTHTDVTIRIGVRCDIGPGVELIPGSHVVGTSSRRSGTGTAKPITIGDGCWIGAHSLILGGVIIGDGCIVAAGAVVTKSMPPNSLVAGVPAKVKQALD
ncbi:WbbJ Acetyltransferase (isoleucine patch superfamily) [Burkholderiaceae bacterium]